MLATVMVLAWPTMLEQVMHTAVQYIDIAMVGSLGTAATAAVGVTGTVNWLIGGTIGALGVGFLSFIARAMGAGDIARARRIAAQTVVTTLVIGSVLTVLILSLSHKIPVWMQADESIRELAADYFFVLYTPMLARTAMMLFGAALRAVGATKTPMRAGIVVNLTNVVLNFLCIYPTRTVSVLSRTVVIPGLGWGVVGAAAASAASFAVGGVLMTIALWRHPDVSPRGLSLRPDREILRPCLGVALPNMLQRFATSLGYVTFASIINSLEETATAAHTIANTVESAFYIPGYGMQTAASTLAGNALGAKKPERLKELIGTMIPLVVVLMTVSGGLLFLSAPTMMRLFARDEAVVALGATVLRMVAVSEPFFGVIIILEGMLLGIGRTVVPFVNNIIGMWGVRIVGTFLLTSFAQGGLVAAWGCMIAHNLLLCLLYVLYYQKRRWNPINP